MDIEQKETLKVAKLEKSRLSQRMLLEPHTLRGKLPVNKVPFLSDSGIVIEVEVESLKPARINDKGQLLTSIQCKCTQLTILNKYVEIQEVMDLGETWIGTLFGFSVTGTGGEGETRGAKVLRFEGQNIIVQGFKQSGNSSWKKVKQVVQSTLNSLQNRR